MMNRNTKNYPPAYSRVPVPRRIRRSRRGAMLVLIAVLLIGFMATVAFSVDIAQMHLSRTELRSATDAAAKAAAIELSQSQNRQEAISFGTEIAADNTVNGQPLLLASGDFEFGRSEENRSGKFDFVSGSTPLNSVRVTGRRTQGSLSGPVPLLFGNVMGITEFEPQTSATATYIERDIVLVVDRSGSMTGRKFRDLADAIDVFVSTLGLTSVEEQVGLASYNSTASEDVQLTDTLSNISAGINRLRTGWIHQHLPRHECGKSNHGP